MYMEVTMRWDATHCQAGVKLDGATASHDTSSWDTVQCDTWLSSGVWDIVVKTQDVDRQSLFLGVVSREHWQTTEQKDEDGDPIEAPMRDSPHALCMHGDGRLFIKMQEKDWGLMRM